LKNIIEELIEKRIGEEKAEMRRREAKLTRRIGSVLNLMDGDVMKAVFGSDDHKEAWQELNTAPDHRQRTTEWLDAVITTGVSWELEKMNEKLQARKVQKTHRTSKSIAMRRYIDKVQSPQCPIETDVVTEHFAETWAPPTRKFQEANQWSTFYLEERLQRSEPTEM
jgi:hypothetical protein